MQSRELLAQLETNLAENCLTDKQQEILLGQLKVLGRDPASAVPIAAQAGIRVLGAYGLDRPTSSISHEALRCICNAFVLNEAARESFIDLGFVGKLVQRLSSDDDNNQFLAARLLFLLTYAKSFEFDQLLEVHEVAGSINRHLARHAAAMTLDQCLSSVIEEQAMAELLRLMFNITYFCPASIAAFDPSINSIVDLLVACPLPNPPLQPPISLMINALINTNLQNADSSKVYDFSHGKARTNGAPGPFLERLAVIFEQSLHAQAERDLEQAAAPLCTLLRRLYEFAPPNVQSSMKHLFLPSEDDRDMPLGKSTTLASRLLRASSSANLPTLRENIANLLFDLSDKDATKFIQNIGYGYAVGFLMNHNIKLPLETLGSDAHGWQSNAEAGHVNPITGQKVAAEERDRSELEDMTESEKEREAERLFVLFERLKATGVIDVQNPIENAMREGRFEEVD